MMTDADLYTLRGMLALQGHVLARTLCTAVAEERMLKPAFLHLLAATPTAIAAIDAALTNSATAGDAP